MTCLKNGHMTSVRQSERLDRADNNSTKQIFFFVLPVQGILCLNMATYLLEPTKCMFSDLPTSEHRERLVCMREYFMLLLPMISSLWFSTLETKKIERRM